MNQTASICTGKCARVTSNVSSFADFFSFACLVFTRWNGPSCDGDDISLKLPLEAEVKSGICSPLANGVMGLVPAKSFPAEGYGAIALFFNGTGCNHPTNIGGENNSYNIRLFPAGMCLGEDENHDDPDHPEMASSLLLVPNATGALVTNYEGSDSCDESFVENVQFFPWNVCVNDEEDGTSILGLNPYTAAQDMVNIFGGSVDDYPFAPPPPPPELEWSLVEYGWSKDNNGNCQPNVGETYMKIVQNDFCYDNFEEDPSDQMSHMYNDEVVRVFEGFGCVSDKQIRTHDPVMGCFRDADHHKWGMANVLQGYSNIGANTYNMTRDIVTTQFCQYRQDTQVSFSMLDYYKRYNSSGFNAEVFYPYIGPEDDSAQKVMRKTYEYPDCTGNYSITVWPTNACFVGGLDQGSQSSETMSVLEKSGLLDSLLQIRLSIYE